MAILASAADARYGTWLLNLLGSVKANSDVFDRIVVHDLGLTPFQRRLVAAIRDVELRTVPPFVPHWRECFSWKPWIWTHLDADEVLYLDAGLTVLRPLQEPLAQIRERGYFLVSQGNALVDIVPSGYYERFALPRDAGRREYAAAGIIGFRTSGEFFDRVIAPTYDDVLHGLNLGWSASEAPAGADAIVRDCKRFRHDQTLLNIHVFKALADVEINDVYRFGGWLSPHDHPDQLIWNHRRRGDHAYLPRVPYRGVAAIVGRPWGVWFRWRWWARNHSWLFRPATYLAKARRLARP